MSEVAQDVQNVTQDVAAVEAAVASVEAAAPAVEAKVEAEVAKVEDVPAVIEGEARTVIEEIEYQYGHVVAALVNRIHALEAHLGFTHAPIEA